MVLLEHRPGGGREEHFGGKGTVEVPRDGRAPVCVMKGGKPEGATTEQVSREEEE